MYAHGEAKARVLGQVTLYFFIFIPQEMSPLSYHKQESLLNSPNLRPLQTCLKLWFVQCMVHSLPQQERLGDLHGASGHTPSTVSKQKEKAAGV